MSVYECVRIRMYIYVHQKYAFVPIWFTCSLTASHLICINEDGEPAVPEPTHIIERQQPLQAQKGGEYIGTVLRNTPVAVEQEALEYPHCEYQSQVGCHRIYMEVIRGNIKCSM